MEQFWNFKPTLDYRFLANQVNPMDTNQFGNEPYQSGNYKQFSFV